MVCEVSAVVVAAVVVVASLEYLGSWASVVVQRPCRTDWTVWAYRAVPQHHRHSHRRDVPQRGHVRGRVDDGGEHVDARVDGHGPHGQHADDS